VPHAEGTTAEFALEDAASFGFNRLGNNSPFRAYKDAAWKRQTCKIQMRALIVTGRSIRPENEVFKRCGRFFA